MITPTKLATTWLPRRIKAVIYCMALFVSFSALNSAMAQTMAECGDTIFFDGAEDAEFNQWEVAIDVSELGEGEGRMVTLTLNGNETLEVSSDGLFCFMDTAQGGQIYMVDILVQPTEGDLCSLVDGTGTANSPVLVGVVCDAVAGLWDQMLWDQGTWN